MRSRQLIPIVKEFRAGLLGRRSPVHMCLAVCMPLQGFLSAIGVEAAITEGHLLDSDGHKFQHFWLTLPDGRIIDPTADQFSLESRPMPSVYVGKLPEWYFVSRCECASCKGR